MASARHKHVLRAEPTRGRRLRRVALPAAAVLALGGTTTALAWPDAPEQSTAAISFNVPQTVASPVPMRVAPISRSAERVRLEAKPPKAVGHLFATAAVNIRTQPSEQAPRAGSLEWGEKVPVSGKTRGEWTEVVIDETSLWVNSAYLAEKKPRPEPEEQSVAGAVSSIVSAAACASGSDVEAGLVANAIAVHRAVCAAFPSITSYGGVRDDSGEHGTGQALDVMVSGDLGWEVAEYVRANAGDLGVSEVLYSQKIWTVERSSEGWRSMEDRGSTTANHYDHVHVTVY